MTVLATALDADDATVAAAMRADIVIVAATVQAASDESARKARRCHCCRMASNGRGSAHDAECPDNRGSCGGCRRDDEDEQGEP